MQPGDSTAADRLELRGAAADAMEEDGAEWEEANGSAEGGELSLGPDAEQGQDRPFAELAVAPPASRRQLAWQTPFGSTP